MKCYCTLVLTFSYSKLCSNSSIFHHKCPKTCIERVITTSDWPTDLLYGSKTEPLSRNVDGVKILISALDLVTVFIPKPEKETNKTTMDRSTYNLQLVLSVTFHPRLLCSRLNMFCFICGRSMAMLLHHITRIRNLKIELINSFYLKLVIIFYI